MIGVWCCSVLWFSVAVTWIWNALYVVVWCNEMHWLAARVLQVWLLHCEPACPPGHCLPDPLHRCTWWGWSASRADAGLYIQADASVLQLAGHCACTSSLSGKSHKHFGTLGWIFFYVWCIKNTAYGIWVLESDMFLRCSEKLRMFCCTCPFLSRELARTYKCCGDQTETSHQNWLWPQ